MDKNEKHPVGDALSKIAESLREQNEMARRLEKNPHLLAQEISRSAIWEQMEEVRKTRAKE